MLTSQGLRGDAADMKRIGYSAFTSCYKKLKWFLILQYTLKFHPSVTIREVRYSKNSPRL